MYSLRRQISCTLSGVWRPGEMTDSKTEPVKQDRLGRNIGVGCFTFVVGAVSCAMIGVGVGKAAGYFTRCTPAVGLPACDWWIFAGWGAAIGAVTLPVLALLRLRSADRKADAEEANAEAVTSDRG